jgi:fibrillarin-like pre-rRNA processing protein
MRLKSSMRHPQKPKSRDSQEDANKRDGEAVEESAHTRVRTVQFDGGKRFATLNLVPDIQVYGEKLLRIEGAEYRIWDAFRSKLAAALVKGLDELPLEDGSRVLYLGVSTGTTASHISDIIGKGVLFGVEVAPRVAREFIDRVVKYRKNVIPIIADARRPEVYNSIYGKVDLLYCDIAQPDQTDIAIANCVRYLKRKGHILLVVKARSIDVTKEPKIVFEEEEAKLLKTGFQVKQMLNLEPYDKDHVMIHAIWESS